MIKLSACIAHRGTRLVSTPTEAADVIDQLRCFSPAPATIAGSIVATEKLPICCPAVGYARELVRAVYRCRDVYI